MLGFLTPSCRTRGADPNSFHDDGEPAVTPRRTRVALTNFVPGCVRTQRPTLPPGGTWSESELAMAHVAGASRSRCSVNSKSSGFGRAVSNFLVVGYLHARRCECLCWVLAPQCAHNSLRPLGLVAMNMSLGDGVNHGDGSSCNGGTEGSFVNNLTLGSLNLGALRRCESLVWLATRRAPRLASHPNSAAKCSSYFLTSPNMQRAARPILIW